MKKKAILKMKTTVRVLLMSIDVVNPGKARMNSIVYDTVTVCANGSE